MTSQTSPMIIHCAETIKGGIATYLRELVQLQREMMGPDMITLVIPASQREELPLPDGVNLVLFDDSDGRAVAALRLAWRVARLVRETRPLVVHIHSTFAGATVRPVLAVLGGGVRVVYCPHGWAFDRPMSGLGRMGLKAVERLFSRLADAIVCISEHERKIAIANGLPPEKLRVVLNGVADRRPASVGKAQIWPEGKKRVLFVGRFDRQKGVDVLSVAMSALMDEAHAVFAGGSVLNDGNVLVFPENVTNVGWRTAGEIETLLDGAEVLIVPSRWEGFGLIAVEAMRAGRAVIASRVGGLQEVVEHGVTGLLVAPESADEIITAVRKLDPATLLQMGEAGRSRFLQRFSMERVHRELTEIYGFSSP